MRRGSGSRKVGIVMRLPDSTREACGGDPSGVGCWFSKDFLRSKVLNNFSCLFSRIDPACCLSVLLFAALLLLSLPAISGEFSVFAQADVANATIKGFVADQEGGGVSRAIVTATSAE